MLRTRKSSAQRIVGLGRRHPEQILSVVLECMMQHTFQPGIAGINRVEFIKTAPFQPQTITIQNRHIVRMGCEIALNIPLHFIVIHEREKIRTGFDIVDGNIVRQMNIFQ